MLNLALIGLVGGLLAAAKVDRDGKLKDKLNLGGIVTDQNRQLSNCANGAAQLENCGPAPDIRGITGWLNTPGGAAVDLKSLRGKVVLVDFWAYSGINCQRAIPHVADWYDSYRNDGFEVIGVHNPEYAFEKVPANVASDAMALGITYPVALDNSYSTWTNYRNSYWPAEYLIDASGTVRHIKFGGGDYGITENLIRQLIGDAHPGIKLPAASHAAGGTPRKGMTPETYFAVGKVVNYGGGGVYDEGSATFDYPSSLADNKDVFLVVGGTGTVTVTDGGRTRAIPISGPPTLHQIVANDGSKRDHVEVQLTQGLQAFSFTYG